jgi:hypothetical protein
MKDRNIPLFVSNTPYTLVAVRLEDEGHQIKEET